MIRQSHCIWTFKLLHCYTGRICYLVWPRFSAYDCRGKWLRRAKRINGTLLIVAITVWVIRAAVEVLTIKSVAFD